jgi:hypothetical protein
MPRKSKETKIAEEQEDTYNQKLISKRNHYMPAAGAIRYAARNYNSNDWRKISGSREQYQGIYVFAPIDPYTQAQREEFRSAMSNPYVRRASRIHASFVCGQGYTTDIVPRSEEELPREQQILWSQTTLLDISYWNTRKTPEQIKDWVDKLAKKLKLSWNVFNAYYTALEQGRCVLALTPLMADKDSGKYPIPEQIRLIRTEFTLRPLLHDNTGELEGVYAVGVQTGEKKQNVVPADRMLYIMHAFNNELYSDYYGDSMVSRISDIANSLNVVFNQDMPNASKTTWSRPGAWIIPIPPQEFGNEQTIVTQVANKVNEGEGKTVVLTGPSNKDDISPTFIPGDKFADIAGLDTIRLAQIKAIIVGFGIPGFMVSEADVGALGGSANLEEIDNYLNTEIANERIMLEEVVENQFYDKILCILFGIDDADKLPIRIKHKFNKPKLVTLLPPELYQQLLDMQARGLIDETGLRDFLGLTELDRERMSTGSDITPNRGAIPTGDNKSGWDASQPTTSNNGWGVGPQNNNWSNDKPLTEWSKTNPKDKQKGKQW